MTTQGKSMTKKSILITGASGFIGRNVVEQLGGKYDIAAPNHHELDLMDTPQVESYLKRGNFDAVVHGANVGGNRKVSVNNLFEKNLRMFQNVARCSSHFGKMIQLGSGAEYDKSRPLMHVREEEFGVRVPQDEYGRYKYECSKYVEAADNIICLRIFGCYGKYEDYEIKFISNAICKSIFSLPITIANRNAVFSYLNIDDFVCIVEHFIKHDGAHKSYNVVPNEIADLLTIAGNVKEISGSGLPVVVKNPGMTPEYTGDNSRLRAEIPGFQFTSLDDGIRKLHSWYIENKSLLDLGKISIDKY